MPIVLLESAERPLAERLLAFTRVFDVYTDIFPIWTSVVERFKGVELPTDAGGLVTFAPREVVGMVLPVVLPISERLVVFVAGLNSSTRADERDLWRRIDMLDLSARRLTSPDEKAVFILMLKACEDQGLFDDGA